MEASVCGEASSAASNHRAWYEATGGHSAAGVVSSAPSGSTTASTTAASAAASSDQLDAYFKGSNATTAAYFSQMQAGAYPGMSYHGESFFVFHHEKLIQDFLKKEVGDENLNLVL